MLIVLNKPYDMLCQFTDGDGPRDTGRLRQGRRASIRPGGWTATAKGWWC